MPKRNPGGWLGFAYFVSKLTDQVVERVYERVPLSADERLLLELKLLPAKTFNWAIEAEHS